MSPYFAIVGARFRCLLQYRAAAVAGIATQIFWGLIRMMIFIGFYESSCAHQPMSMSQTITYVWLGQAMFAMLPWNVDSEIQAMMRSGTVVYELLRPLDLYNVWFSRAIAMRVAPTLLRSIPIFILGGLFLGLRAPASAASGLAWAASTVGAIMLACAITNLLSISLIWTVSGVGVTRLLPALVATLSGSIIPLPLFPDWAQPVLRSLPFRDLVDTPFRLYMGSIPVADLGLVLLRQAAWVGVLVIFGRAVLARGMRQMVVHGG